MLDQKLEQYGNSDVYPFHMPGHKRVSLGFGDPYLSDITEISGFDNLHQPEGEIKTLQDEWAKLYGAKEAFVMVNGSTGGILASIFSAIKSEEELLIARNSHRSVYHGAYLRNATLRYLYPQSIETAGGAIAGEILSKDLEETLEQNPDIKAVLCTSPTYEGVVSDISALAEIAHNHGATLIVDCAHGAHFGLDEDSFPNPITQGADLVITSLHKTLPAFTSTALLLKSENCRIPTEDIMFYLDCFETSSPSYLLMASVAKCLNFSKAKGTVEFKRYHKNLDEFYKKTKDLKNLKVLQLPNGDKGKILISGEGKLTGKEIFDILRNEYDLELEMASGGYCLAMTSLMDTKEGFQRLAEAVKELDETVDSSGSDHRKSDEAEALSYPKPVSVLSIKEAVEGEKRKRPLSSAANCIAGEFVSFYPPGIPILAPGELITQEVQAFIKEGIERGLTVSGMDEKGIIIVDS